MATNELNMRRQNDALRYALLSSAPSYRIKIATLTGQTAGSTSRVKLANTGVLTKLVLDVSFTYTVGTATATLSAKAPFNIINRIRLTDYANNERVNVSGYQLWIINCIRAGTVIGYNNESQTSVLADPVIPVAVGAQTAAFQIEVPVAFDPGNHRRMGTDLRGAILQQTSTGETNLVIEWNPTIYANANSDAVFNGAGTTTISAPVIAVDVWQEFLLPQPVNGTLPMPFMDFATIYELNGMIRVSSNIAAGQETLFNYPNGRAVIGAYFNYLNNGTFNSATTDISRFRLVSGGSNYIQEYTAKAKLFDQRLMLNGDIRPGTYFELHRDRPILTEMYGNFQYGITPLSASGLNAFEVCYESFIASGAITPGLTQ